MKVTKIVVTPVRGHSRIKATATILFDDVFKVRGLKIMPRTKGKGLFLAFPETRNNRGDYFALAFPVTKELRQELEDQVLYLKGPGIEFATTYFEMIEKETGIPTENISALCGLQGEHLSKYKWK